MQDIRFATAGEDIKIWDYSSMTVVDQFNPHTSPPGISSLCWSTNNHFLASASASGDKIVVSSCKSKSVQLFTLAEGEKQTCLHLHSNFQYLVSGGLDNTVNIWELKSRRLHRSLKDHKDEVTCVRFNGNDGYIASGSTSGEIILHSVTTNLSSAPFGHGSTQPIRHLKYSVIKKSLLGSVSDSGNVTLWDVNSQNSCHIFDSAHKAPATEICFSPVNDLLFATTGLDKRIIFYDTASKKVVKAAVAESPLTAVEFLPDGLSVTVGSSRGKIYQYDLRMLTSPVKSVAAHKTSVQSIQFQHNNIYMKSNSKGQSSRPASILSSAVNKRNSHKGNVTSVGTQNSNMVKDLNSIAATGVLVPCLPEAEIKGNDFNQDKTGVRRSTSLDVIPSKETDYSKSVELKISDAYGRSSLGDMFSPIRDDPATYRANEDFTVKGDGRQQRANYIYEDEVPLTISSSLDHLSHVNTLPSIRRNPVGASSQGPYSSPLHIFSGTPIKEEDENQDSNSKTKLHHVKPETIDQSIQVKKLSSSNTEVGNVKTPPSSSVNMPWESSEKTAKQVQTQLIYDIPSNGISLQSSKITPSVTAGVASSLSEKIVGAIEGDRTSAPLTAIQINFIKNMIQETVEDVREACHRDIVNLQVEMIKQFHMQLNEMHTLLEKYSVNEGLISEIEKLREENKRLRTNF
ncbi:protein NEDD1-like isoform X2 [Pleurodeles waltl]|uniref:protein NEDD1-like isoform X2 n=1 Tax=Pleurodeles waltl TaxID=8319 RepID=UPI0037099E82